MYKTLKLGISSCPNDTFMFDALINKKIDTKGLSFNLYINDIENLNKTTLAGEADISKISYATYPSINKDYIILDSGSALGFQNGPLVVSKRKIFPDELKSCKIAIPGIHTTANMLFTIIYPDAVEKKEYLFSEIEDVVLNGEMDAGLIIHENRFTYLMKGLQKVADIGEIWNNISGLPIPLGAIVANRNIPSDIIIEANNLIRKSIEFAFQNPSSSYAFVKKYAYNLDDEIIKKHIDLYVNDYSVTMGKKGKEAINYLLEKAAELKLITPVIGKIFLDL